MSATVKLDSCIETIKTLAISGNETTISKLISELMLIREELFKFTLSEGEVLHAQSTFEEKSIELDKWDKTIFHKFFKPTGFSPLAFTIKESYEVGEEQPWFCAKCYENKKLSFFTRDESQQYYWVCPECRASFKKPPYIPPKPLEGLTPLSV